MQFSEIKTTFTGILNRRDITPTQITSFLTMGVQYIQRKLRVPPMEKVIDYTCDGTKFVAIPGDFLEIIAIYTDDAVNEDKLERRDLETVLRASRLPGSPKFYCRSGANLIVGPIPPAGSTLVLNYYADISTMNADTDHNWLTDAAPSLMVYAGLKYASDFFLDDRKQMFQDTFNEDLADIQELADRDELVNATMSPVYPDQTEDNY